MSEFKRGMKAGLPICFGYLSVSFSFGIIAVVTGLTWWQAVIVSMTNVTSAGQLAGVSIMVNPMQYFAMFLSQLTINVRYSFMSVSLSQKTHEKFAGIYRWLLGFMMTDEIFGVAVKEKEVTRGFFFGMGVVAYIGWATGTALGAILGDVLPARLLSALGIALYAMFVAIVVPEMTEHKSVVVVVILAIIFSCAFRYIPVLSNVSAGISISICAIVAAIICALVFPVPDSSDESDEI